MQLQRNLNIALITFLAVAAIPFAPEFLALFPTLPASAQTTDARTVEADRLSQQASQQYQTNQFQAALQSWQQALTIYQQIGNKKAEGTILHNLGAVYDNLGQYADALKYYQQALVIAKQAGNKADEGTTLNNIAVVYNSMGQYADALKYYQQALVIAKQAGNKADEGTTLNNMGSVYDNLGQYADALKYYQQALVIAKQVGDKAGEGTTLNNIGLFYTHVGQYADALKYYQQALVISREVGDKKQEGNTLNNFGYVYDSLGQYDQALKFYQQSLAISREIGNRGGEGKALHNLGLVHDHLDQYSQALKFYQQSLTISREINDAGDQGRTLNNIGGVYNALGQYSKALEFYQQALPILRKVGERLFEGTTLNNIGYALLQTGKPREAEKNLRNGVNVWESLRSGLRDADKVSVFEQQATTYRFLQQALIAQKKTNMALEIAERGRARAFVELLATRFSSQPTTKTTITPPTFRQIQQISKNQNATLVEYSITYDAFKVQGKEEWRQSELYIWVVKPTGEVAFRQVDLKNLDKTLADVAEEGRIAAATGRDRGEESQDAILADLVHGTRDSISKGSSDTATNSVAGETTSTLRSNNRHLQQMHQVLIQPIIDLLPSDPEARVFFIPHESLFLVPFPALQDANGKYLIEKHTILTAPAIQVLDLTHQQRQRVSGKDMLVVGNPTMPSIPQAIGEPPQKLAPLPAAEQEAIEISSLLNTKAITGSQATETAIKQQMPRAGIIHLATHGLLDDFTGGGVPGAIALAPSGKDNGLLSANEILDLKLGAELVVLSACDTGRGRITGDGVIGLSRSLISAGVPSVVVSLWKVPDEPTASLMTEFYRQLQQKPDKAAALRQAMLTTMKKHPQPRNWAAFTLIGEAR